VSRAILISLIVGVSLWGLAACGTVLTPPPLVPGAGRMTATPTFSSQRFTTPLPPTPTYTPSPTPTPIIYVVQSGDTLLGIAIQYGVTLDALQRANAISDPRFLREGQSLIIPTGEEAEAGNLPVLEQQLLPTPTPVAVQVQGLFRYSSPLSGEWCTGEIYNPTSEPLTNIQLEVTLAAADGTVLGSNITLLSTDYLSANGRAPFAVLFSSPGAGAARCTVKVWRAETIGPVTAFYRPLKVVDAQGAPQGPRYNVQGRLLNQQEGSVQRPNIVVTFYNRSGQVLGYRHVVLRDRTLAVGETVDFEVVFTPPAGERPANFRINAWGEAVE